MEKSNRRIVLEEVTKIASYDARCDIFIADDWLLNCRLVLAHLIYNTDKTVGSIYCTIVDFKPQTERTSEV